MEMEGATVIQVSMVRNATSNVVPRIGGRIAKTSVHAPMVPSATQSMDSAAVQLAGRAKFVPRNVLKMSME